MNLVSRRPTLFSIGAILVLIVLGTLLNSVLSSLTSLSPLARRLVVEVVFGGYVIVLLTRLHWWREVGFVQLASPVRLLACVPLLFLPAVVVTSGGFVAADVSRMLLIAIFTFLVAFVEEGLMRGVVLRAMQPAGLKRAVILSSLIFGLSHLINISVGRPISSTIVQVIYATLIGIGLAGARVYTGTIWPGILIHFVINFVGAASRGFEFGEPQPVTFRAAIGLIEVSGIFALYGWWLLWRKARENG